MYVCINIYIYIYIYIYIRYSYISILSDDNGDFLATSLLISYQVTMKKNGFAVNFFW